MVTYTVAGTAAWQPDVTRLAGNAARTVGVTRVIDDVVEETVLEDVEEDTEDEAPELVEERARVLEEEARAAEEEAEVDAVDEMLEEELTEP